MKNIYTLCFIIFVISACAPTSKIVKRTYPTPFEFSSVDSVSGTKDQLFVRAFEWVSRYYGSAKAVVDMHDKEAGKIIGKAKMAYGEHPFGVIEYVISIDVRDDKYRFVLSNFVHSGKETVTRYGVSSGITYSELNKDKVIRRMPDTGKKGEDKLFYKMKNYVMDESTEMISSFNEKIRAIDSF